MARKKINVGDWVAYRVQEGDFCRLFESMGYTKLPASPATLAKWYRMLPGILKQLEAMNCSSAHAASWCEPRSQSTTKLIKRIRRIAKGGRGKG